MAEAKTVYQVIYVNVLGDEAIEVADAGDAEKAIAYCKDPAHWPGHLIARKVTTEDLYDTNDPEEGGT